MELKCKIDGYIKRFSATFNRTAYGIEIDQADPSHSARQILLIAPLMELKYFIAVIILDDSFLLIAPLMELK